MTIYFSLWIFAVGITGGWLGGRLMTGHSYGRVMDILMGVVGAGAAGISLGTIGIPGPWGYAYATSASFLGAALVSMFVAFLHGKKYA
jgi:uncharacterized membrane protein YeaQ/YmgE (transglycosylase-associated protein family)